MNLREPTAVNYRGERLSVRLGIVLSGVTFLLFIGYAFDEPRLGWVALGVVAVFLAGLYDDARPARTRGMRRQLAALRHGDVTPGAVKLAVIGAASAFFRSRTASASPACSVTRLASTPYGTTTARSAYCDRKGDDAM